MPGRQVGRAYLSGFLIAGSRLRVLRGLLLGGEFCFALFTGGFDPGDHGNDDHGQQNQRGQRGGQTQNDVLHAAGEAVQPSDRESDSFWPKVRRTGTVGV